MSVGHGPVIFIWKAAAQLEREKRTTKSCYPTEEKKQNRNSGWSYCINGLAKKKTLSLVLSVIDAVDVFLDDPFPIFLR